MTSCHFAAVYCNRKAELLTYFQTENNLSLRFLSFIFTQSQAINQSSARDSHHSLRRIDRLGDEIIYIMNCRYVDKRKRLLPDFIILFGSMVVILNSYFVKQRDNDTMSLSVLSSHGGRVKTPRRYFKAFI